jgi:MFS family permease
MIALLHGLREMIAFERSLHGEERAFFWLSRAVGFGFQGIYLAGFNLYLLRMGYGADFIGIAFGITILMVAIGAFIAGYFTIAPRTMVITSQVLALVSFTALYLTDLLPEGMRTPWVLGGDALGGFSGAIWMVGRSPYLMSITTPANRMAAFSLDQVGGAVAGFLGSLVVAGVPIAAAEALGVTLEDPAPFRFALLTAPLVVAFALLWFMRTSAPRPGVPASSGAPALARALEAEAVFPTGSAAVEETAPRASTLIAVMTVVALLFSLGDSAPQFFFNVYMDVGLKVSPTTTAIAMGIARVVNVIPILALPVISRRWSNFGIMVVLASTLAVAALPLALIPHGLVAAGSYIVYSMVRGAVDPVFEVLRMNLVSPRFHTRMASRVQGIIVFSMAVAGIINGTISESVGYNTLFLASSVLIGASVLVLLAKRGLIQDSPPPPT